jgi:mRNA-degrading endonuclease YafQ of YafQ-DinJ toxin-antitoxin module
MSIVESLLEYHSIGPLEIIEWTLLEDSGWSMGETKSYRKGMNKYQSDGRVMKALQDLLQFVMNQPKMPSLDQYPHESNVHPLRSYPKGTLWAHLKGQHIGVVFRPNYQDKQIELLNLCTHDQI